MTLAPTLVRVVVALLGAVATVSQVAYLDALSWHSIGLADPLEPPTSPAFLTLMMTNAAVSIGSAVLAVWLVLHEGDRQAESRALGTTLAAWSYMLSYSGVTLLLRPDPGTARTLFDAHFLFVEMVGLMALLRFSATFPRQLSAEPTTGLVTLPAIMEPVAKLTLWVLRPSAPWILGSAFLAAIWGVTLASGRPVSDAALHPAMDVFRFAIAGLVVLNFRRSWAVASPDGRERLKWLLVGLASIFGVLMLYVGGNVLMAVTDWPEPAIAWRPLLVNVGVVGFVLALAMSVLHQGGRAPGRLASRIASAAAVGSLGLFLAAALEALFEGGLLAGLSLGTGAGTVIAFALIVGTHRGLVRAVEGLLSQLGQQTANV